jgi:hypothetical protein
VAFQAFFSLAIICFGGRQDGVILGVAGRAII